MNIHQVLYDNFENVEISWKNMRYLYELQTASDKLQIISNFKMSQAWIQ